MISTVLLRVDPLDSSVAESLVDFASKAALRGECSVRRRGADALRDRRSVVANALAVLWLPKATGAGNGWWLAVCVLGWGVILMGITVFLSLGCVVHYRLMSSWLLILCHRSVFFESNFIL